MTISMTPMSDKCTCKLVKGVESEEWKGNVRESIPIAPVYIYTDYTMTV